MDDVDYTVRTAAPEDLPAIRTALAHAIDWRGHGGWESPEALIEQTGHTFLLAEWGREGDGAVVAEVGGRAVGAAWRRYWTDASHSYGYVDAVTPEIGVGVDPGFRRRGIGTSLMTGLLAQAARQGVQSVSLSVERYNPAVLLYRRLGFEHHADLENAWTMLKRLDP